MVFCAAADLWRLAFGVPARAVHYGRLHSPFSPTSLDLLFPVKSRVSTAFWPTMEAWANASSPYGAIQAPYQGLFSRRASRLLGRIRREANSGRAPRSSSHQLSDIQGMTLAGTFFGYGMWRWHLEVENPGCRRMGLDLLSAHLKLWALGALTDLC